MRIAHQKSPGSKTLGETLDGHEMVDFQDPKEPPQLMLPEVIALSTLAMVFRLGTFQEFILVR